MFVGLGWNRGERWASYFLDLSGVRERLNNNNNNNNNDDYLNKIECIINNLLLVFLRNDYVK